MDIGLIAIAASLILALLSPIAFALFLFARARRESETDTTAPEHEAGG
jgi:hypothetical protein